MRISKTTIQGVRSHAFNPILIIWYYSMFRSDFASISIPPNQGKIYIYIHNKGNILDERFLTFTGQQKKIIGSLVKETAELQVQGILYSAYHSSKIIA
uniref:Uncharacterized protein n=1 Tax=Rhizophora mucronata TaxID=61149 RepID=A0A2P2IQU8_RHIMU